MVGQRSGFSLLELSIVLVIIGLLAGGVMTGQSLIHAAEVRAISTDYTRYMTATNAFRDKYQALPGDMKNATAFWGIVNPVLSTCNNTIGNGTETCNGDGSGTFNASAEFFRFWQQLANAGLIEGNYTGIRGANGPNSHEPGSNAPASRYPNIGWSVDNRANSAGGGWFAGDYGNLYHVGGKTCCYHTYGGGFTPADSWSIDKKSDDGLPGQGLIMINNILDCTTATVATDVTATYRFDTTAVTPCSLMIKIR